MTIPHSGDGSLIKITLEAKVAGGSTKFVVDAENSMLVDWPDAFEVDFTVVGDREVATAGCAPTGLEHYPDSVNENEIIGTTVGSFIATDADAEETSLTVLLKMRLMLIMPFLQLMATR